MLIYSGYLKMIKALHGGLNPEKKQARLDFFLISDENIQYVDDCLVVSGYRTET